MGRYKIVGWIIPGRDVIMARRKGNAWYIGGISADQRREKQRH